MRIVGSLAVLSMASLMCLDGWAMGADNQAQDAHASSNLATCGELKAILFDLEGNLEAQSPVDTKRLWKAATNECRRAVDASPDAKLAVALRSPLQVGGPLTEDAKRRTALAAPCALHPRWALPLLLQAVNEGASPGCCAGLAEIDAPESRAAADRAITKAMWRHPTPGVVTPEWFVSVELLAAATLSLSLRERLAPVLATAFERRAGGYDALRDLVCADVDGKAVLALDECARFPRDQERHWLERRERRRDVGLTVAAIAVAGAAVTAAALTRNDDAGPVIAAGTAAAGVGILTYSISVRSTRGEDALAQTLAPLRGALLAAALAIPAGIVTYFAARDPGAAPVIASSAGATLWLVGSLTLVWD